MAPVYLYSAWICSTICTLGPYQLEQRMSESIIVMQNTLTVCICHCNQFQP